MATDVNSISPRNTRHCDMKSKNADIAYCTELTIVDLLNSTDRVGLRNEECRFGKQNRNDADSSKTAREIE